MDQPAETDQGSSAPTRSSSSSLVDNIFKEFLEKKEEALQKTRLDKEHKKHKSRHHHHHKKHKRHKDDSVSQEETTEVSKASQDIIKADETSREASRQGSITDETSRDTNQEPHQSITGQSQSEPLLDGTPRSNSLPEDGESVVDVGDYTDMQPSGKKKKKHKKHKHKEKSKHKHKDRDRDKSRDRDRSRDRAQESSTEPNKMEGSQILQQDKCTNPDQSQNLQCDKRVPEEDNLQGSGQRRDHQGSSAEDHRSVKGGDKNVQSSTSCEEPKKSETKINELSQELETGSPQNHPRSRDPEDQSSQNAKHRSHRHSHSKRSRSRDRHREREARPRSRHHHRGDTDPNIPRHSHDEHDERRQSIHLKDTEKSAVRDERRVIDLVGEDKDSVVITLDNSPEHTGNEDLIYEGMEYKEGGHRRRKKHKSQDRDKHSGRQRNPEAFESQHTLLQHLWEEDPCDESRSFNSTEELNSSALKPVEKTGYVSTIFSTSGSQWMQLPKDMERSADVNASSWMRLPKELEVDEMPGYDSDKDLSNFSNHGNVTTKKKKVAREPRLDVKLDIGKALAVKPPPSDKTAELISSIKNEIIGDLHKSGDQLIEAPKEELLPQVMECPPQIGEPPEVKQEPADEIASVTSGTAKKKASIGLKLGIKISESSAALIASGEKVEAEPLPQKKPKNLEEGEVSDSSSSTATEESDAEGNAEPSGSSSSDIRISELSSSGSLTDSEPETTSSVKRDGKKRDKKAKQKKKKKKHKSEDSGKKRPGSGSRSRSPKRHKRSRSRSGSRTHPHSRGFDEERGVWRTHGSRTASRRSRSRDRSRDRHRRSRDRPRSRDRYRGSGRDYRRRTHRSRSPVRDRTDDLRVKIDKAKLRQIALRNAYAQLRAGGVELKPDVVAQIKAGGKSVEELTDFCKKIADKDAEKQLGVMSSDESSDAERERGSDEEAPFINHPFKVKDAASIIMNIRNARQLPLLTPLEKQVKGSELRLQFPVSSGSHHRDKEKEWVPVEKNTTTTIATMGSVGAKAKPMKAPEQKAIAPPPTGPGVMGMTTGGMLSIEAPPPAPAVPVVPTPLTAVAPEDKVFPDAPSVPINIGSVVSERLSAMRKLQDNPHDIQALGSMYKAQAQMKQWADSKNLPGQFTGHTGANLLSSSELKGIHQAWAKKDQLKTATPISGGIGKMMLERMGWKEGEGLGKESTGNLEPLMLDVKIDRKGLQTIEENFKRPAVVAAASNKTNKDLSGKHPVSALVELCNRRKWGAPEFVLVHESGPDHKKNFLFKVMVNNMEYQSTIASGNKKQAKAQAATVCLQEYGLLPR